MAGVNKAIIMGRLGRDPELTFTPNSLAVCKFSLATSRKQKNGEEITSWHRCTAFGKAGELISQYVSKGSMLYVEGEINYSQYEKNGETKHSTDIIVREFNFISSGGGQQNQQGQQDQRAQTQQRAQGGYQPQTQNQGQGQGGYQPQTQQQGQEQEDIPF